MIAIASLFEESILDKMERESTPEDKLVKLEKSNNRKKLMIAGLLGIPVGMSMSQLIHQIKDNK